MTDIELTCVQSWAEWKQLWETVSQVEWRLGLLRRGFDVFCLSKETYDRAMVYLDIADEANLPAQVSGRLFQWHTEIANAAFKVLCRRIFTNTSTGRGFDQGPSWQWVPRTEMILDRVLCFFCPLDNGDGVANLHRPIRETDTAEQFLLSMCRFAWKHVDVHEKARGPLLGEAVMLKARWPRFVELLWALGRVSDLLQKPFVVDEACMVKLEEIVLKRERYRLPPLSDKDEEVRCPRTIEEALTTNSGAARVLHTLRLRSKYQPKYDKAAELLRQRNQANQQLQALE